MEAFLGTLTPEQLQKFHQCIAAPAHPTPNPPAIPSFPLSGWSSSDVWDPSQFPVPQPFVYQHLPTPFPGPPSDGSSSGTPQPGASDMNIDPMLLSSKSGRQPSRPSGHDTSQQLSQQTMLESEEEDDDGGNGSDHTVDPEDVRQLLDSSDRRPLWSQMGFTSYTDREQRTEYLRRRRIAKKALIQSPHPFSVGKPWSSVKCLATRQLQVQKVVKAFEHWRYSEEIALNTILSLTHNRRRNKNRERNAEIGANGGTVKRGRPITHGRYSGRGRKRVKASEPASEPSTKAKSVSQPPASTGKSTTQVPPVTEKDEPPAKSLVDVVMEKRVLGAGKDKPSVPELKIFLAAGKKQAAEEQSHWQTMIAKRQSWKDNPVGGVQFRDRPPLEDIHDYNLRVSPGPCFESSTLTSMQATPSTTFPASLGPAGSSTSTPLTPLPTPPAPPVSTAPPVSSNSSVPTVSLGDQYFVIINKGTVIFSREWSYKRFRDAWVQQDCWFKFPGSTTNLLDDEEKYHRFLQSIEKNKNNPPEMWLHSDMDFDEEDEDQATPDPPSLQIANTHSSNLQERELDIDMLNHTPPKTHAPEIKPSCESLKPEMQLGPGSLVPDIQTEDEFQMPNISPGSLVPDIQTEYELPVPHISPESQAPNIQTEDEFQMPNIQTEDESLVPNIQTEDKFQMPNIQTEDESLVPNIQTEDESLVPNIQTEDGFQMPNIRLEHESPVPETQVEYESQIPYTQVEYESQIPYTQVEYESQIPDTQMEYEPSVPDTQVEYESQIPYTQVEYESQIPDTQMEYEPSVPDTQIDHEPSVPDTQTNYESQIPETQLPSSQMPPPKRGRPKKVAAATTDIPSDAPPSTPIGRRSSRAAAKTADEKRKHANNVRKDQAKVRVQKKIDATEKKSRRQTIKQPQPTI